MDLSSFNSAQKEAVTLPVSPKELSDALILAGAGSGKTRVLVYRIAYLISKGVMPASVLALTFTKKAAGEMQERLNSLLGHRAPVTMSTFHALASDLLRNYGGRHFEIIDTGDQNQILKRIIKEVHDEGEIKLKDFKTWFSYQRNRCVDPEKGSISDDLDVIKYREIAKIYRINKSQIGAGVLDFDDLLEHLLVLLETNDSVRESLQKRFEYILVDEYQDTNKLQFDILSLLRGNSTQLLQVGDEDQLIYSWRGAEISHILNSYKKSIDSENVHCVILDTNYRCSGNILTFANTIVAPNNMRAGKTLVPHKKKGKEVSIAGFTNSYQESEKIASTLSAWNGAGLMYDEMAVLMRTNRLARDVERALISEGVPYVLHNATAMFDSREVKLLMSLLRFTSNPDETFFFSLILDTIKMGIGPAAIAKLDDERKSLSLDWIEFLKSKPALLKRPKIKELVMFYADAKLLLDDGEISEAARSWLHNWDLMQFYKKEEREKKTETLLVFFDVISDYEKEAKTRKEPCTIIDFQEQRLLNDALLEKNDNDAVHIMSIHKSKGLEFKRGFILGMQDGVFPVEPNTISTSDDGADSEEDRRLAYVAITRFMDELILTRTYSRVGFQKINGYSSLIDPYLRALVDDGVVKTITF